MIRHPAVAGQFYTADRTRLREELASLIIPAASIANVIGIVSPHAGYMYSGAVAGELYGHIALPSTVVILGPNHSGIGASTALYADGEWITPLGTVTVNTGLARLIGRYAPQTEEDRTAHQYEHSLEVQVPFLQFLRNDVTIVPLCLGFNDFERCRSLGLGIARAIREFGAETLIVASSDMTHYESAAVAREKDFEAIAEVQALAPERLLQVCRARRISMCGVIPAAVMLVAAVELGATKAELVRYATSGDVTGDNRQVVGYAGLTVA